MTGYVVDTNVISELTRDAPDPMVVAFLNQEDDLWLSVVVVHEIDYGLQLLPTGRRRSLLESMQSAILAAYEGRILPVDLPAAEWAAQFRAQARRSGRVLDMGDALIAGTAKAHNLGIATRNVGDFRGLDVELANPWEPP